MKNRIIERDKLSSTKNSIVVENFHKKFKDIDIGPLSFTIEKGKVTALLGSSGSGKSVFLNSLLGATLSYNGHIYINGKERKKANSIANNSEVGFYSQMDFSLYSISAFDFLKNMCNVMGIDKHQANSRIEYWLKKFDLWTAKDKSLNAFSWGMKNRMNLILCFIKEPQILILDEPGANLDSKWRNHTYDILNQFKQDSECTIILTVHNIDEIYDVIENFVILEKGKLLFNGTKEELNLYKKIKVSFDSSVDLNFVEKTLNQHNILTFDFNERTNSIIVGLQPNQNFNDVLATLEARGVKTKDIVGQPINIDEIQKALRDKITPHQPKYLPILGGQPINSQNNLVMSERIIDKNESEKSNTSNQANLPINELDFEYDEVLNSYDKTRVLPLDDTLQSDDNFSQETDENLKEVEDFADFGEKEIKEALLFLENIEHKYENMLDLDPNMPTLIANANSTVISNNDDGLNNFNADQVEKANEIKAISLRLVDEKNAIEEITLETKNKIAELKALQSEVALATYQESKNLFDLKNDFTEKLVELRGYVEQLRNEDEMIEATKTQLNSQIQELLNLKAEITTLINDEKDLIQSDIKELKQYVSQVHFETEIMAEAKISLEQKADELKEFLAKTDFENQSLSAKQQELQVKFDEIKGLQSEIAFNSFSEHQSLEEIKETFDSKVVELKVLIEEVHSQEQSVDDAKKDLTSKLNDLNNLKAEIEASIREEHDGLSLEITDLKDQLTQIKDETSNLQESKEFIVEQSEAVKKTQAELIEMLKVHQSTATDIQVDANASRNELSKFGTSLKAELQDETNYAQSKIDELKQLLTEAKNEISELNAKQATIVQKKSVEAEVDYLSKVDLQQQIKELIPYINKEKANEDLQMTNNVKPIDTQNYVSTTCDKTNNVQAQQATVYNVEIENIKQNLHKEYAYLEKMRQDAALEKEMNQKLANFDKELKMREDKLELERLKREIQEEKAKLSEFILLQKVSK